MNGMDGRPGVKPKENSAAEAIYNAFGLPNNCAFKSLPRLSWLAARVTEPRLGGRDAIGAIVTVTAGRLAWTDYVTRSGSYLSSHDPHAHFGLGEVDQIDSITVVWPDGSEETFEAAGVDQILILRHGEGRSP